MKKLIMGGIASALLFASSNAVAATAVQQCQSGAATSCSITFGPTSGTFRSSTVVNSPFLDIYSFDITGNGLLSLTLSTFFAGTAGSAQDIDFSLVRVNEPGPGFTNAMRLTGTDEIYTISNLAVSAGEYRLRLRGTVGSGGTETASYAGTLNFSAAVPEPATWAMMLVGFAMVGGASRYRRRSTSVVYG